MKRFMTALVASAALCIPSVAVAGHLAIDPLLLEQTFETEEDCEEALAQARRDGRAAQDYEPGKERGQFNKDFNQRYDCEEQEDGMFMIVDTSAT